MSSGFGYGLAFFTGLAGASHCLGMCGGFAAGFFASQRRYRFWAQLAYHGVRILMYVLLGLLGALSGRVLVQVGMVGKVQGLVMIFSGLLICVLGLRQLRWRADCPVETYAAAETIVVPFDAHPATQRLLPLLAGLLNGFVPCSLVFSVAVKTVAVADPLQAVLLMFSFGLGTLPTMLGVTLSGALVGRFSRGCWQRVTGTLIFAFGAWTLYEGWSFFDIMRGLVG